MRVHVTRCRRREIFTQVREAGSESEHVMLNLAQLHALQGEHDVAVPLYQKVQRNSHGGRSVEVALLEARAFFDSGKVSSSRIAVLLGQDECVHNRLREECEVVPELTSFLGPSCAHIPF